MKEKNEIYELLNKRESAKEVICSYIETMNSFGFKSAKAVDEILDRVDNELLKNIALLWVKKCKYFKDTNWYDGRNEASVNVATDLYLEIGEEIESLCAKLEYDGKLKKEYYEYESKVIDYEEIKLPYEVICVETASREHRTLQQSFSGVMFGILNRSHFNDERKFILPLI